MIAYPDPEPIWADFDAVHEELLGDLLVFRRTRSHERRQWWRRAYCRAISAYLEAVTCWMSRYTIHLYHPGMLGDGERQTLEARLPAVERAFHAFDLFTDTSGARTPLKRGSAEWVSLVRMIRLRNRITHPKSSDDVVLSDDDLATIDTAAETVFSLVGESLDRCSRALLKRWKQFGAASARRTTT